MTLNYLERITLYDLTHTMNVTDLIAIVGEIPRIDSGCSWEKKNSLDYFI